MDSQDGKDEGRRTVKQKKRVSEYTVVYYQAGHCFTERHGYVLTSWDV